MQRKSEIKWQSILRQYILLFINGKKLLLLLNASLPSTWSKGRITNIIVSELLQNLQLKK